jgi:hypothetical protein
MSYPGIKPTARKGTSSGSSLISGKTGMMQ